MYIAGNNPGSSDWSKEYWENFHGCIRRSKGNCRDRAPLFMDCYEACSHPIFKVSLAVLAIIA